MAVGDILSFIIDSSGWFATVKVEGVGVGGSYDFGFGAKNDPTNAKITLNLTSQGYSGDTLGTIARTVYGVPCFFPSLGAMRKVYPNDADPNETVSGSDVDIVIALSEYVYSADTSLTVNFLSGWYTQGTASNSVTGLSVTNNSAASYPKPIGNWAYPGFSKITGDIDIEVSAFHKFGVAAVKISATDGSTTVSETVTDLTISPLSDYKSVLVYASTIDTSGFIDGIITVDFIIYPKVGNASSLLESDDAVNVWPTPLYTSQKYRLDTGLNHGVTVVDPTNGNDGTGVVYNTEAAAEAGLAYQTVAAALTAVQAYNNINAGHNDAGGGTILLTEDTATLNSANGGTLSEWVTIKPVSTGSRINTIFQPTTTNSAFPTMMKCENLYMSGTGYFRGFNSDSIWYDQVDMNQTGSLSLWQAPAAQATHCIGDFPRGYLPFSTSICAYGIVRGNDHDTEQEGNGYTTLGNRNVTQEERINTANPIQNNGIYAFNVINHNSDALQVEIADVDDIDGFAVVQNLIVRYGTQTTPLIQISADGTVSATNNILLWHNTIVGARGNFGYNDIVSGGPYPQTEWSMINNLWSNWNNKDDTFGDNPDGTGGWPVGYGVGCSGDFRRTSAATEWFGEWQGIGADQGTVATPKEPLYVIDNSADGANTAGGDYHLQELSPARDLVQVDVLPYDLEGRTRVSNGSVGALEYYEIIGEPENLIQGAIVFGTPEASSEIIAELNDLIQGAIIFESPSAERETFQPDNLVQGSILFGTPTATAEIIAELDNLVQGGIILGNPTASAEIIAEPNNLVQGAIIFDEPIAFGDLITALDNLVQGSIVLGNPVAFSEVEYVPILVVECLIEKNITIECKIEKSKTIRCDI